MGITLTSKAINSTYDSLLKLSDNDQLTGAFKVITDGLGNDTGISINNANQVNIAGQLVVNSSITANSFVKSGGLSGQFLKADGSVDSNTYQSVHQKGLANGYAPLDSGAKISEAYLPDSIVGQLEYQGTWNASTNTPTLPSASTVKGHYYVVNVAGTYNTIEYAVGDWVISNGTSWEKVDNTDAVTTVFGRLGAIVANQNDYSIFYHPLDGDLDANASTATTLQTARFINGTSFDGSANITTSIWGTARNITIGDTTKSLHGGADVTWTRAELGITKVNIDALNIDADTLDGEQGTYYAAASSLNNYLPLTGGNLTGDLNLQYSGSIYSRAIKFQGAGASAYEIAIRANGEGLEIYEPEDANKVWLTISDDPSGNSSALQVNSAVGMTPVITNYNKSSYITKTYIDGLNVDADTLDSLTSTQFLRSDTSDTMSGTLTVNNDIIIKRGGVSYKQPYHSLYVGGDTLDDADTAIYIGSRGDGSGYGYEFFYEGTGTGNNNKFKLISENLGTPKVAFEVTADGDVTFPNNVVVTGSINIDAADLSIGAANLIFDTLSTNAVRGIIWDVDGGFLSKIDGGGTNGGLVEIYTNLDGAITTGDAFRIKQGNSALTAFSIDGNGYANVVNRLAIGKTGAPATALDIVGGIFASGNIATSSGNISASGTVSGSNLSGTNTGDQDLSGYLLNTTDTLTGTLSVTGNLGIGTTSPGEKLTVSGNGRFSNGSAGTLEIKHNYGYQQPNWGIKLDGDTGTTGGYLSQYVNLGGFALEQGGTYYGGGPWKTDANSTSYSSINGVNGKIVFYTNTSLTANTPFSPSERMRIDSSGNVGIGTTSPSSTLNIVHTDPIPFRIARSTAGQTAIRLTNGSANNVDLTNDGSNNFSIANAGAERMRIDSSGRVGIGTTSPDVPLEVVSASPTNGIVADFVNSTNAGGTTAAIKLSNADSEACDVVLGANRVGANFGSDFFISLSDSVDGSNQERFRITEAGNVGIGTSSPASKLHILQQSSGIASGYSSAIIEGVDAQLDITSNSSGTWGSAINLIEGIGSSNNNIWSIARTTSSGGNNLRFNFGTSNQHDNPTKVTFDSNGNVGIGTTSPYEKLEVAGDIRLSTNGRALKFDTLGEGSSAMVRCENNYELSIFTVRGSAGFGTFGNSDIRLGFGSAHSVAETKLYINPSGQVGIGTTSPAAKLDVNGTIKGNYLGLGTAPNTTGPYALNMGDSIDMNAQNIDYVSQLHFNDNVRFYDDGNDSYLNFKYGDANYGGIRFKRGDNTLKGYLYADNSGFGLLDNDGAWAVRTQTGTSPLELSCDNNVEFEVYNSYTNSPGSSRAPIFYDSNNTGYYVDAASTSVLNELDVLTIQRWYRPGGLAHQRVDARLDGTDQARSHWYGKNDTGGTSNFKHAWYDGSSYINVTAASGAITFDRSGGTADIIADGSFRAPIFYDSDNTTYYLDPASTSDSALKIRGGALFGPNTTWGNYLMVGGNGRQGYLNDASTASVTTTNGNLHLDSSSGKATYINYYDGIKTYFGSGNESIVGEILSDGSARFPIFYDYNNTSYYLDPAGQSRLGNIERLTPSTGFLVGSYNTAGQNSQKTNPIYTIGNSYKPTDTSLSNMYGIGYTTANPSFISFTGASDWGMYVAADGDARVWLDGSSGNISSKGSLFSANYYDYNNTAYYVAPSTTGTSINVRGEISNPSIWINDGDNSNNYNENIRLFNAPNGVSVIAFSASGAGGVPTTSILGYSDRFETRFGNDWQTRVYNGYVAASGSFRAPIFYDSNNTGYYLDPNGISNLQRAIFANGISVNSGGSSTTKHGVSLYGTVTSGMPAYGLAFTGTAGEGTHGSVTSDWATYFTMSGSTSRGWIFKHETNRVASISGTGNASFNGDVIAYFSDMRLKTKLGNIENPIEKIQSLNGFYYEPNEIAESYGYKKERKLGLSAQEVEAILPEIVTDAPIGDGYKTVDYAKLVPVLIEAIKEQQKQIDELKQLINK